jgi:hypothetical protein
VKLHPAHSSRAKKSIDHYKTLGVPPGPPNASGFMQHLSLQETLHSSEVLKPVEENQEPP